MYTNDKILRGGEITSEGKFSNETGFPFYIFLAPKNEDAESIVILTVKLPYGESTEFPFSTSEWNPVSLKEIEITSEDLSQYRIFWGAEK